MANYDVVSEETKNLFIEVRNNINIPNWVEFELLANDKQKQLYKIIKLNDMVETITEGINFVIVINEEIFNELNKKQKFIALDECLAGVSVNEENEAISLEKPNFTTYRGVLNKHGHDEIIILHESIKSLFDKKKEKEDERKALSSKQKK